MKTLLVLLVLLLSIPVHAQNDVQLGQTIKQVQTELRGKTTSVKKDTEGTYFFSGVNFYGLTGTLRVMFTNGKADQIYYKAVNVSPQEQERTVEALRKQWGEPTQYGENLQWSTPSSSFILWVSKPGEIAYSKQAGY